MIPFDFELQKRIFKLHFKHLGFSPTTLFYLFISLPMIVSGHLIHQFFFLMDEIFFRSYRKISTDKTIFIVGPPRCGTSTMLDILNHSDEITSMKMWGITVAPAISEKLLYLQLGKLDRFLGSPLFKLYNKLNDKLLGDFKKVHDTNLFNFEEDAMLFYHSANSPYYPMLFPFEELKTPFLDFDQSTTPEYKRKYMNYYKRCIQKHLYVYGKDKIYLSKNPNFCPWIHTIKEHFKTAKFIFMTRTPYKVVPSILTLSTFFGGYKKYNLDIEAVKIGALTATQVQYNYPFEAMDFEDKEHYAMIQFDDLVSDPKETVENLLNQFDLNCPDELQRILDQRSKKEKNYVSQNKYSFEKYNISHEEFLSYFEEILVRFGYEEAEAEA